MATRPVAAGRGAPLTLPLWNACWPTWGRHGARWRPGLGLLDEPLRHRRRRCRHLQRRRCAGLGRARNAARRVASGAPRTARAYQPHGHRCPAAPAQPGRRHAQHRRAAPALHHRRPAQVGRVHAKGHLEQHRGRVAVRPRDPRDGALRRAGVARRTPWARSRTKALMS